MATTDTTGLVMEKIRKIVWSVIGAVWPGPWTPKPSRNATLPRRPTSR